MGHLRTASNPGKSPLCSLSFSLSRSHSLFLFFFTHYLQGFPHPFPHGTSAFGLRRGQFRRGLRIRGGSFRVRACGGGVWIKTLIFWRHFFFAPAPQREPTSSVRRPREFQRPLVCLNLPTPQLVISLRGNAAHTPAFLILFSNERAPFSL